MIRTASPVKAPEVTVLHQLGAVRGGTCYPEPLSLLTGPIQKRNQGTWKKKKVSGVRGRPQVQGLTASWETSTPLHGSHPKRSSPPLLRVILCNGNVPRRHRHMLTSIFSFHLLIYTLRSRGPWLSYLCKKITTKNLGLVP